MAVDKQLRARLDSLQSKNYGLSFATDHFVSSKTLDKYCLLISLVQLQCKDLSYASPKLKSFFSSLSLCMLFSSRHLPRKCQRHISRVSDSVTYLPKLFTSFDSRHTTPAPVCLLLLFFHRSTPLFFFFYRE